jgi:hypothetical protein
MTGSDEDLRRIPVERVDFLFAFRGWPIYRSYPYVQTQRQNTSRLGSSCRSILREDCSNRAAGDGAGYRHPDHSEDAPPSNTVKRNVPLSGDQRGHDTSPIPLTIF